MKKLFFVYLVFYSTHLSASLDDIEFIEDFDYLSDEKSVDHELTAEEEKKLLLEFSKIRENNVKEIIQANKKQKRFKNSHLKALELQLSDIIKSRIEYVIIEKGARIERISDQQEFYLPKDLKVRAHVLLDYNRYRYIINKKGHLKYRTPYKYLTKISSISNLSLTPSFRPKVDDEEEVIDKFLDTSLFLKLHLGLISPSYLADIIDAKNANSLYRVEGLFSVNSKSFVDTGVSLMYESLSGETTGKRRYKIHSFSLGPSFLTKNILDEFKFVFQTRFSIYSLMDLEFSDGVSRLEFAETSLLLALEKEVVFSSFGRSIFGFSLQRKWAQLKTSNRYLDTGNHHNFDDSAAFYIGHRSDWLW